MPDAIPLKIIDGAEPGKKKLAEMGAGDVIAAEHLPAVTSNPQLDAHEADTDNPHAVTAAQTGAATELDDLTDVDLSTPPELDNHFQWNGTHMVPVPRKVWGDHYQMIERLDQQSTDEEPTNINDLSQGTFPTSGHYNTLTTPADLPLGDYMLEWTYTWSGESTGEEFLHRMNRDNGAELFGFQQQKPNKSDERNKTMTRHQLVGLQGAHTIRSEFASEKAGEAVYITGGTLSIYRVR